MCSVFLCLEWTGKVSSYMLQVDGNEWQCVVLFFCGGMELSCISHCKDYLPRKEEPAIDW